LGSSIGKTLGFIGMAVGFVALAATGVGLFVGAAAVTAALGGISAATLMTVAGALSIGSSILTPRPKAPTVNSATVDRLQVTLDPLTPRKSVFGNTALAADMRDQEIQEPADVDYVYVHRWIVAAAHRVHSIDEVWLDGVLTWNPANPTGIGEYKNHTIIRAVLEGNAGNVVAFGGKIGSGERRFTGCAYVYVRFLVNSDGPFAGGIPNKILIKGRAMPTYDPRKDDTVPGGFGSQRANDNSTWQYDSGGNLQGENPPLQMLSWLLGWKINGKLSVGKGVPAERLDLPSFITAANLCDEAVALAAGGSERRYTSHGIVSEGEEMTSVLDRWKAACNADVDDVSGKIRLQVFVNDIGAPAATFTDNDILDEFSWRPSTTLPADYNIVRGRFVDPSPTSLFELDDYPEVKLASRDGIDRPELFDLPMVQSRTQAERLAKQRLQRAQYPGVFEAVFQFGAHRVQKGDPVRLTFSRLNFVSVPFRVLDLEHRADGHVPMRLRLENAAIYAWDMSETAPVAYAAPVVYSLNKAPQVLVNSGEWAPPTTGGNNDANLLRDAQFGTTYWTRNTLFSRRLASEIADLEGAQMSYAGQVALGSGVAVGADYNKTGLTIVTPGRTYYPSITLAKSPTAAGAATVRYALRFYDNAGALIGAAINLDIALADLPAGGVQKTFMGAAVAPAGAYHAEVRAEVLANGASGFVWFDNPLLLDKEPGEEVTKYITGNNLVSIKFKADQTVDTGQLPKTLNYSVQVGSTAIAAESWHYKVITGTLNGNTAITGNVAMTGTTTGQLVIDDDPVGIGTNTAEIDVYAVSAGKTLGPFRTKIERDVAPAPNSGGGSGSAPPSSHDGTIAFISGSPGGNFTFQAGPTLSRTPATGQTKIRLAAGVDVSPFPAGSRVGTWQVEGKWQRESSPGSGTWSDVGSVVSAQTYDQPYGYTPGHLSTNLLDTGRSAGVQYNYRFMVRMAAVLAGDDDPGLIADGNLTLTSEA
jgi:hypothetical protein